MDKVDLKKELGAYTARRGRFDLIDVPPQRYLAIDGAGDPNTARAYADAVGTLFPVAYTLKFAASANSAATTSFRRSRRCGGPTT